MADFLSMFDQKQDPSNTPKEQQVNPQEGQNENQIYDYLKDKYGEWILYDPKFDKNTYFLWLLPILMFVLGGAIILKIFYLKMVS